jgi:ribonuclease E
MAEEGPTTSPAPRRKPQIGDSIPAKVVAERSPGGAEPPSEGGSGEANKSPNRRRRPRNSGTGGAHNQPSDAPAAESGGQDSASQVSDAGASGSGSGSSGAPKRRRRRRGGKGKGGGGGPSATPIEAVLTDDGDPIELDEATLASRRGRHRNGQAVGRFQMNIHVTAEATHVAVMEGRQLIEHYVSRKADDASQIHGNIYMGRVENVLPGMEAAFVDISTPKNAVVYRSDVIVPEGQNKRSARIEEVLKARQLILCQVTKNPIAHKGARLTQEVSLPGRFVVLVPNSTTYGISKRLPDDERKRLRKILDKAKPKQHGVIVRTAAQNITAEEIQRDVARLLRQWDQIEALAKSQTKPGLLYREPDVATRIVREEFNADHRSVVVDDRKLFEELSEYVTSVSPALADRIEHYDPAAEGLSLFERHHVYEQLHKALDRKVWLPSGGSLIIEGTEALTVIDVNTGRNVGKSSLEETVFRNNLEAAEEVARQLRLRDIGGIIVIDFVDMDVKKHRDEVLKIFKAALARDKTRTHVAPISDLGLVEMTRKRIGEGLLESFADRCASCEGRGMTLPEELLG